MMRFKQADGEVGEHVAELQHLRPQRLPAREGEQLPHEPGGAVGILLDLHQVLERGIGRPVVGQEQIRIADDGGEHVVEVVRDAAGELADRLHLLRLRELRLQRPLLGGVDRVHDRGLALARALHRRDVEARRARGVAGERRLHLARLSAAVERRAHLRLEAAALALRHHGEDRTLLAIAGAAEQAHEARVAVADPAFAVDGGDRHRRVVEEAREAHLGVAQRIARRLARAAQHQRARRAGRSVAGEGHLVVEPHRQQFAVLAPQIKVEDFRLHLARHRREIGQECRPRSGNEIGKLQPGRRYLGEVVAEPARERRVQINDAARGLDREEAGGSVVEKVDRVLQLEKGVFLPLALARDFRDPPHRELRKLAALGEWPHAQPHPAAAGALRAGDADFLAVGVALARRLHQAVDRLRDFRVAGEQALHRPHVVGPLGAGEIEIRAVGVEHAAAGVDDRDSLAGGVDHRLGEIVAAGGAPGEFQDPGGAREQREDADHGERRQHRDDVGLRLPPPDEEEEHGGPHQRQRHQEHQADAARRLTAVDRGVGRVVSGHREHLLDEAALGGTRPVDLPDNAFVPQARSLALEAIMAGTSAAGAARSR